MSTTWRPTKISTFVFNELEKLVAGQAFDQPVTNDQLIIMDELTQIGPESFKVEIDSLSADQFAIILSSGCPPLTALTYFYPDLRLGDLKAELERWMKSAKVRRSIVKLQGKEWEKMSLQEKLEFSINKHYSELAFFLYNTNYNDLIGAERAKADVCRTVIESKLAGMAGKQDAMTRFFDDFLSKQSQSPVKRVPSITQ